MRYDKHVTLKATLLAILSVITGTYIFYNVGEFMSEMARLKELANWSKGETTLVVTVALATVLASFLFSLFAFGRDYDHMPIFNIMFAYMLGFTAGMVFGLIRHFFLRQYYGTVGIRILEIFIIFCMFAVPHRLYSMRRYCVDEPKKIKELRHSEKL